MNYIKHYDALVQRAKNRIIEGYTERHHVVPTCLGGANSSDNLVILTAREHYVAHLLLVKIYPSNHKLVHAAVMMTMHSVYNKERSTNRRYEWLRKQHSIVAKQRKGSKNGSYGKPWYHNPVTLASGKFLPSNAPSGWIKGKTPKTRCVVCDITTGSNVAKFCKEHLRQSKQQSGKLSSEKYRNRKDLEDAEKFTTAITTSVTWKEAIFKAGFKTDGYSRTRLQRFATQNNLTLMASSS